MFFGYEFKKGDVIFSVGIAALFIIANLLSPVISIGLPSAYLSIFDGFEKLLFLTILVPIFEEAFFRVLLGGILLSLGVGPFKTALITAAVFSLFHITAYGATMAVSGAYLGAFVFGLVAFYLMYWKQNALPNTVLHGLFNAYLVMKTFVVV